MLQVNCLTGWLHLYMFGETLLVSEPCDWECLAMFQHKAYPLLSHWYNLFMIIQQCLDSSRGVVMHQLVVMELGGTYATHGTDV